MRILHKRLWLLLIITLLFKSNTQIALSQESPVLYDVLNQNKISIATDASAFEIKINNNQTCNRSNCLLDVFFNKVHLFSIDFVSSFYIKNETDDDGIIRFNVESKDLFADFQGYLSIRINPRGKSEDPNKRRYCVVRSYGNVDLTQNEASVLRDYKYHRVGSYIWNEGIGCITLLLETARKSNGI